MTLIRTSALTALGLATLAAPLAISATATAGAAAPTAAHTVTVAGATTTPKPAPRADQARAQVTYLVECLDDNRVRKPRTFTLACADANHRLTKLTWKGWGSSKATATGRAVLNTCSPSCAKGREISYPVKVTAGNLVEGEASATYRKLTVSVVGKRIRGVPRTEVFHLPGNTPGEGAQTMYP